MSQILGMGLTHYPGLLVPPDNWPRMLKRGVEIGRIPADLYAALQHARPVVGRHEQPGVVRKAHS